MLLFIYCATQVVLLCELRRHLVPRCEGDSVRTVCVSFRLKSTEILIMSYNLCWMSL